MFRWKPAIAGKKATCACGASVIVPSDAPGLSQPTPGLVGTTSIPPKQAAATSNAAGKASPQSAARKAAAVAVASPRVPAVEQPPPDPLENRRDTKTATAPRSNRTEPPTLADPFRDYIAPAILLALGLAGIGLYAMRKMGTGPIGTLPIPIALAVLLGLTIVKTVALILASVPLAALCKVKLGLMRTAILKLAGTIFFGDAAILWLVVAMPYAGTISKKVAAGPQAWLIHGVALAVIYFLCFGYLFGSWLAAIGFSALMALVSRLCNFLFLPTVIALIESLPPGAVQPAAVAQNIPAIRSAPTTEPQTAMTVQPSQPGATALDEVISRRINTSQFHVQEGYAWCQTSAADDADKKLISQMYGAGAVKVYMDGFTMYAQLPSEPTKRNACLSVAQAFRNDNGIADKTAMNSLNYQYCVIDLFGERLKGWHPATQP